MCYGDSKRQDDPLLHGIHGSASIRRNQSPGSNLYDQQQRAIAPISGPNEKVLFTIVLGHQGASNPRFPQTTQQKGLEPLTGREGTLSHPSDPVQSFFPLYIFRLKNGKMLISVHSSSQELYPAGSLGYDNRPYDTVHCGLLLPARWEWDRAQMQQTVEGSYLAEGKLELFDKQKKMMKH